MRLTSVRVANFRILGSVRVDLAPGLNVFVGDNGAGKSSVFEALGVLARGRVEGGHPRERVGPAHKGWSVEAGVADTAHAEDLPRQLRVRWEQGLSATLDGSAVSARELSRSLALTSLSWASHQLLDEGPAVRRRFLDWAVFHVEQSYAEDWARWRRLLSQRNSALAAAAAHSTVTAWDPGLAEAAETIDLARHRHQAGIAAALSECAVELGGLGSLQLRYRRGWPEAARYDEVLRGEWLADQRAQRTRLGPQRADLELRVGERGAGELSRGQQKLILASLMVAAAKYVAACRGSWPVLIIDDFDAELAVPAQERLAALLQATPAQLLIAQHRYAPERWPRPDARVFHVEHGVITPAVQ